jgi:hypothetical protein
MNLSRCVWRRGLALFSTTTTTSSSSPSTIVLTPSVQRLITEHQLNVLQLQGTGLLIKLFFFFYLKINPRTKVASQRKCKTKPFDFKRRCSSIPQRGFVYFLLLFQLCLLTLRFHFFSFLAQNSIPKHQPRTSPTVTPPPSLLHLSKNPKNATPHSYLSSSIVVDGVLTTEGRLSEFGVSRNEIITFCVLQALSTSPSFHQTWSANHSGASGTEQLATDLLVRCGTKTITLQNTKNIKIAQIVKCFQQVNNAQEGVNTAQGHVAMR